jgi:hypothetical protein
VEFRQFEREFLRLAFTTSVELTPASLAFIANLSIQEAEQHMQALVSQGVLELQCDDEGRLTYTMPDRPSQPFSLEDAALIGSRQVIAEFVSTPGFGEPPRATLVRRLPPVGWDARPVTPGQAVASMFLNAMVCPGVGSLVGGRTGTGLAQLSLFLVGLPLAVITIGLPLMLAAWIWGIASGAQLIAEARD